MKTLWKSTVGSHMWKMNHSGSDIDVFACHIIPTKDLLIGAGISKSIETNRDIVEEMSHEIGKVVHMIASGNVNFIWGLTSPIIQEDSPWRQRLLKIYQSNISKNCFHSIYGLAMHNCKDYVDGVKEPAQKRMRIIYRTIGFGIGILCDGKISYDAIDFDITPEILKRAIASLIDVYWASELPEQPDYGDYNKFLYDIRISELMDIL